MDIILSCPMDTILSLWILFCHYGYHSVFPSRPWILFCHALWILFSPLDIIQFTMDIILSSPMDTILSSMDTIQCHGYYSDIPFGYYSVTPINNVDIIQCSGYYSVFPPGSWILFCHALWILFSPLDIILSLPNWILFRHPRLDIIQVSQQNLSLFQEIMSIRPWT